MLENLTGAGKQKSRKSKKAEDKHAARFPEMTSQLDSDAMFALQVANYEVAKKCSGENQVKV